LVIDALRHDFIEPTTSSTAPFLGRFPIVGELQALEPWSTRRNKLEADPPTVTAQRLKAIATGTLPTFLDLRKNFASPSVAEDNWLAQLKSNRHAPNDKPPSVAPTELRRTKKPYGLGMLGDDTWEALFPGFFRPSAPMSSFNTRDLHSVDDEVLEKLPGYIKGDEWAVMVRVFIMFNKKNLLR
jgi:phosphatidylinositol glycan class O